MNPTIYAPTQCQSCKGFSYNSDQSHKDMTLCAKCEPPKLAPKFVVRRTALVALLTLYLFIENTFNLIPNII